MSSSRLIQAAQSLSRAVTTLHFAAPITHTYNPLEYAWAPHEEYLRRFGDGAKKIIFVGMNPGPFGMVQIGVPFGEIAAARDWMGISAPVQKPAEETPARPIEGWACARSEVSGRRLWGLFAERFGSAEAFFAEHFVANYCPLAFFEGKRNVTHDLDTLAALSTRVAVLAEQRILAYGTTDEIIQIDHPFIRNFFLSERSVRALQNSRPAAVPH